MVEDGGPDDGVGDVGNIGHARRQFEVTIAGQRDVLEIAGATILNDSYNSNPEALRSMIQSLASRPAQRRILIAGEMLEMGTHAEGAHAACGKAAAEAGIDLVVGVRGNAQHLAAAACWGGTASIFLPDAQTAGEWLAKNVQPGDVILIKGSRGVGLERSIDVLKDQIAIASSETQ